MPLMLGSALHTGHIDRTVAREDHILATLAADGVSRCQALSHPGLSNYFSPSLALSGYGHFFFLFESDLLAGLHIDRIC
jgi:hypothetical protein